MYCTDEDWTCIGEGKFGCGAMGAMMTGKLKFLAQKRQGHGGHGTIRQLPHHDWKGPRRQGSLPLIPFGNNAAPGIAPAIPLQR